ncbi:MAG TPA: hypothetical protein VHE34_05970 [Puia sp.]|uniref:hypothetical protein n=1 Tax=Puia sp. TaxID=2045100 RepID=UPI002CEB0932|nr:hypothetical protein [Puia sp.]HVU94749.1 hypothetical protein [Puia sp.]
MSIPVGRRSNLLLITLLIAISILLEQFFIAPIFPWLGNFGSIRPMIVFLDIPLELPAIDLVPASILFALFYQIAPSAGLSREHPSISSGARVWKALTGWWTLLALLLAGGGCFHLAQDYLPRSVSNGIDSFGIRADLTLPYPSGGLIHLHGSVVMLLTTALGIFILNRRTITPIEQPQPAASEPQPLSSSIVSNTGTLLMPTKEACPKDRHKRFAGNTLNSEEGISGTFSPTINEVLAAQRQPQPQQAQPQHGRYQPQPQVAEVAVATAVATAPEKKYKPVTILPRDTTIITPEPPPTCRLTTPPPIAVVMPKPAPGIGKMHPCYVIGSLRPVKVP